MRAVRSLVLGAACAVASASCGEAQPSRMTPAMQAELDSMARLDRLSAVRNAPPAELLRITARKRRAIEALHAAQTRDEAHRAMLVSMCETKYLHKEHGGRDGSWLSNWMEKNPPRSDEEWREWRRQERRVDGLLAMGVFDTGGGSKCDSLAPLRDTSEIRLRVKPDTARLK